MNRSQFLMLAKNPKRTENRKCRLYPIHYIRAVMKLSESTLPEFKSIHTMQVRIQ